MQIWYYQTDSPAEAFDLASKDYERWQDFAVLVALGEMAKAFREGFTPTTQSGSGKNCYCDAGWFLLFDDNPAKGLGIGLLQLAGHEVGIDDAPAQEILDFHRWNKDEAFFAIQLLDQSDHIDTLEALDRGYQLLEEATLIFRTGNIKDVTTPDGTQHQRPEFCIRRPE